MDKETRFKEAVESNRDRIFRICCCYVRDEDQRKDVFQDVLIHIWESLHSFEGRAHISTWIYRITVNTCLGYKRTEYRRRKVFDESANVDPETTPDIAGGAEGMDMDQEITRLYDCINQLQPIEKTLVSLYLEDLSTAEMADIVGISEGNVRVKLHRIKKALKEKLEGNGHGT